MVLMSLIIACIVAYAIRDRLWDFIFAMWEDDQSEK